MEEIVIETKLDTSGVVEEVKKVEKEVGKVDKSAKKTSDGAKKTGKAIGGWGTALKSTGILLLIGAIVSILNKAKEAVFANAQVAEAWEQKMAGVNAVFNRMATDGVNGMKNLLKQFKDEGGLLGVFDKLKNSKVGEFLENMFSSPQEFIKSFGTLVKTQVMNRLVGLKDTALSLIGIFKNLFTGNLDEAADSFKEFNEGLLQVATGIKDPLDKVAEITKDQRASAKTYTEEMARVAAIAAELTKSKQDLIRAEGESNIKIAQYNVELSKQKTIGDDIIATDEERLAALSKAQELQTSISLEKITNEKERLRILVEEGKLADNTAADDAEIANQKAKIIQLEADANNSKLLFQKKYNTIQKKQTDEEIKNIESIEDLKNQNIKDETERTKAILKTQYERDIALIEQSVATEEIKQQLLNEVKIKYDNELDEIQEEINLSLIHI